MFASSYDFVNRLRWNDPFTGYALTNVLNGNQKRSWTGQIAREFTDRELEEVPDWSVLAFPRLIQGLPDGLDAALLRVWGKLGGWLMGQSSIEIPSPTRKA